MEEYISREALKRDLIDNRSFYPAIVKKAIENAPTADVVPRSEVAKLQSQINRLKSYDEERDIALHQRLVREAKQEVASEILTEFSQFRAVSPKFCEVYYELEKKYLGETK